MGYECQIDDLWPGDRIQVAWLCDGLVAIQETSGVVIGDGDTFIFRTMDGSPYLTLKRNTAPFRVPTRKIVGLEMVEPGPLHAYQMQDCPY